MPEGFKAVDLLTVCKGAAVEKFQVEIERVLKNIADPNTDWRKKRKITLTFTFQPSDDRMGGAISVESDCKLAAHDAHSVPFMVMREDGTGQPAIFHSNVKQMDVFTAQLTAVGSAREREEETEQ